MRAVLIDANKQTLSLVHPVSLEDLQKIVGGYVEFLPLGDCEMMLNEEAHGLDLPVNPLASRWAKQRLAKLGRGVVTVDGWILGNALVVGLVNKDGDSTDLPEKIVRELMEGPR